MNPSPKTSGKLKSESIEQLAIRNCQLRCNIKSGSHTIHCCPHPQPLSHGRGEPESGRGQDGFVNRIWYNLLAITYYLLLN
ncbi:MAG: hypothetical protein KME17_00825 [Cyanosarcina radialis HA8281-LM2]|jgi:hypothetical protein|nr:hypothetical protein [Cyanosarcina radialis HA8281-LM2]